MLKEEVTEEAEMRVLQETLSSEFHILLSHVSCRHLQQKGRS